MLAIFISSISLLLLPKTYKSINWFTSMISLLILFMILLIKMPPHTLNFILSNKYFTMDMLNIPLITLTLWISVLMIMASFSIKITNQSKFIFINMILSLNALLLLTFSMSNIILFYISFESTLIPILFIILGWGYQPERLQAGFYLMIYTILASLPLLISIMLIFQTNNTLSFFYFFYSPPSSPSLMTLWWLMTILAFMAKMPLYSLHLWLPKAHVEAPVAGSMILAGLLLKLGSYGLLRLAMLFTAANLTLLPMISALGMWGAVITSMVCLRQPDMKALIAYSSIGHMALLTTGIMTNSTWGWEGALLMMIAHGLCSSAMFALANMQYETTQTRNIFLTKGMLTLFPFMTMLWFISSSANMAAPPSLNIIAEIILLSSILSISLFMAPVLMITSFLAAAYSLFLFTATQHGAPSNFTSPMQSFKPRNYINIIMHLTPLFLMCLKTDMFMSWLL